MSDKGAVEVPVELLKALIDASRDHLAADDAHALLPKPKPRLLAVTREQWDGDWSTEWFDAQPDLLTTLDDVIDDTSEDAWDVPIRPQIKARIRVALGVES